jgi:hypothetical protein
MVFSSPGEARSALTEWVLVQSTPDMGDHTLYVAPDAVRIVSQKNGYQILAKAPSWKVQCFRAAEKVIWTGDMELFNGLVMTDPYQLPLKKIVALRAIETGVRNGLKFTKYAEGRKGSIICGADDIQVAAKGSEFICRYYYVPSLPKVPLYRRIYNENGKDAIKKTWLDRQISQDLRSGLRDTLITKSWKRVPFNSSDFDSPANYKKVNDIKQVAYSAAQKNEMKVFLDEIGFTSDYSSRKAQSKVPAKSNHP